MEELKITDSGDRNAVFISSIQSADLIAGEIQARSKITAKICKDIETVLKQGQRTAEHKVYSLLRK